MLGNSPFAIPHDFHDFYRQYPRYVRNFVRRYLGNRSFQELQDREGELTCFLLALPERSKYRARGTNGKLHGCKDRIMTFNPDRSHGDSPGHFFGYINRILRNQFLSLETKKQSNPVTRQGVLRIVDDESSSNLGTDNEIREDRISVLCQQPSKSWENPTQYATVSKFLEFVRKHNCELIPILESISSCSTYSEAQADLGLDDRFFNRARSRLKMLYKCFATGKPVPKQRRVYRLRKGLNC